MTPSSNTPCVPSRIAPERFPVSDEDSFPALDEESAELYRFAARRGFLDSRPMATGPAPRRLAGDPERLRRCIATLLALHLLRESPDAPSVLLPVSPAIAQAEFLLPLAVDISRRQRKIDGLRSELTALVADYNASRPSMVFGNDFESIDSTCAMRAMFDLACHECKHGVTIAYSPASLTVSQLAGTMPYELALLDRGIPLRVLLPHNARSNITFEASIRKREAAGAELRTSVHLWAHDVALFDGEVALTPLSAMSEDETPSAGIAVRSRILLDMLGSMLDWAWHNGVSMNGPGGDENRVAASEVTASVARLLEKGLKDEAVARRLGISLRTCRKHIAHLMDDLGAGSRFQAGVYAVRRGLLG